MTTSQPFDLRLPTPGCHNDPERAGLDAKSVFDGMTEHLFFTLGKLAPTASRHDLYMALSYAVRDRLMMRYLATKNQEVIVRNYLTAEDNNVKKAAVNAMRALHGEEPDEKLSVFQVIEEAKKWQSR